MNKSTIKNAPNPTSSGSGEGKHDLIDRRAAIEALARMMPRSYTPDGSHPADEEIFRAQEVFVDCIEALEILPSAQPERKRGKWIKLDMHAHLADHKCSVCEQECYVPTCMGEPMYDFCPNCGADMRGGDSE